MANIFVHLMGLTFTGIAFTRIDLTMDRAIELIIGLTIDRMKIDRQKEVRTRNQEVP